MMMNVQAKGTHRAQRRRPTIAKEWQLAVLKKLQSESGNPTEEQRSAAAAETGLDERWVRNWFTRQRSKLAARNRTSQLVTTEPHKVTSTKFKLQLCRPPATPSGPQGPRSVSTPTNAALYLPSPASQESQLPSESNLNTQAIPGAHASVSLDRSSQDPATFVPRTTTIPKYSRDPLCNRYPDFSQFFRPQVHERFHTVEFSATINNYSHFIRNPNTDPGAPTYFQSLVNLLNPLHLGSFPTDLSFMNLRACPVAFSMRLADLLGQSSPTRYPGFPPPELGYRF